MKANKFSPSNITLLLLLIPLSIVVGAGCGGEATEGNPNNKLINNPDFHSLDPSCHKVSETYLPASYQASAQIFECNDKTCVKIILQYIDSSIQCVR